MLIKPYFKLLCLSFVLPFFCVNVHAEAVDSEREKIKANPALELVVVTGRKIENYSASDALTGTKSNALLKDLPLSVSVVPQELIQDRSLSYLGEALDNVSGAQRKQGYGGTQNFGAYLRGFDSSFLTLRNGIRDAGFYTLRDAANVERFEVLKGPGSVLYGALYPGGITNTITKKPVAEAIGHVSVVTASHDRYRLEADFGGAAGNDVFFRFIAAAEDAESFRDGVKNDGYFVAPSVMWRISESSQWTLELEHKQSDFTWELGLPRNVASFDVPTSRFLGEPDSNNDVSSTVVSSTFDYQFNHAWRLKQVVSYAETSGDYQLRSAFSLDDDGRTAERAAFDTDESSNTLGIVSDLIGEFEMFKLDHRLVIGVDYYEADQSYYFDFLPINSIDLFEPEYGGTLGAPFPLFAEDKTSRTYGAYIQDSISLNEHWKVLAGLRYDWNDFKAIDTLSNSVTRDTDDNALSPQLGLVYQPNEATSLYASYSKSFLPARGGATVDNSQLKPEKGQQFEVGIKRTWLNERVSSTLALFSIAKQNVNTPDLDNPLFVLQTGEQKSRGLELDIAGSPINGWSMAFGAAYIDAYVSKDNRFEIGAELPGAAKYSASFWNKFIFKKGPLRNLSFGFGAYYVDERQASLPSSVTLPSYTRLDMFAAYPIGPAKLQLNIKNLTDKDIYDLTSTSIMPQEPRSVSLRFSYDFF